MVLVHTQKVGIKYKKPLSLTWKKTDLWQSSQSTIRRFDSSHLSQAFLFSENFLFSMTKARQMRAFLIAQSPETGVRTFSAENSRKSPAEFNKTPVFRRLALETLE